MVRSAKTSDGAENMNRPKDVVLSHPHGARGIDESMGLDMCMHSLFGLSKCAAGLMVVEYHGKNRASTPQWRISDCSRFQRHYTEWQPTRCVPEIIPENFGRIQCLYSE